MTGYEPQGITTSIRFTSRASIKIKDNFYTVEACEERAIPDLDNIDLDAERENLWATVNNECDNQIQDILALYKH